MYEKRLLILVHQAYYHLYHLLPCPMSCLFVKYESRYDFRRKLTFKLPRPRTDVIKKACSSLRSWRDSGACERAADPAYSVVKPAREFASGEAASVYPSTPHQSPHDSWLLCQNKSTRARNPASYAGFTQLNKQYHMKVLLCSFTHKGLKHIK